MSKKNDASGSSARSRSTSSLRPKRRIVTWNGNGLPSGRSAIASPSRIASRRASRRAAATTSGTATVTSFSWREKTRPSSPRLCTWMRAPSSLYSNAASPSWVRASSTSSAAWASIGWTGRNSSTRQRARPGAPSVSAACATAPRSPASIAARRTRSESSVAARATASATSPSSAPWRSSPLMSRSRNSCSPSVARPNSSRSSCAFACVDPFPVVCASRSSVRSTSANSSVGASAARSARPTCRVAYPMPMRPWRGDPERNATTVAISSGAARFRRAGRSSISASRPPVWATAREVWTRSWRRTPLLHHAEPLVPRSHLEEVPEPLPEYFRPAPRGHYPADADPLVRCGKALEVLPDRAIPLEAPENVVGDHPLQTGLRVSLVIEGVLDAFQAEPGHAARGDQPAHPLAVHGGEAARGAARREALGIAIRVDRLEEAVDPTVAQRLFHGVVVRDARLAALLLVVDQPDLGSGAVVLGKPRAPLPAIRRVEGLADVHPQSSPLQRREEPHDRDHDSQGDLRGGRGRASQHRAPSRAHGRGGRGSRVLEEGRAGE